MMGAVAKPTIGIIGTGAIGGFYGVMRVPVSMCTFCCAASFARWPKTGCK